jgi:hypothetical protein
MALCPLTVLYPLYCLLYCPLSAQHPFPSLSPLRPFVLSTLLCLLYSPLSPLKPSAPSTALCSLYRGRPLKNSDTSEVTPLVSRNVLRKCISSKHQGLSLIYSVSAIFAIITITRDYRSCEKLSENSYGNRDYHIQQEAIIGFRGKMKSPFRINRNKKTEAGRQVDLNTCSHKSKIVD